MQRQKIIRTCLPLWVCLSLCHLHSQAALFTQWQNGLCSNPSAENTCTSFSVIPTKKPGVTLISWLASESFHCDFLPVGQAWVTCPPPPPAVPPERTISTENEGGVVSPKGKKQCFLPKEVMKVNKQNQVKYIKNSIYVELCTCTTKLISCLVVGGSWYFH